jgi:hypothetical protein
MTQLSFARERLTRPSQPMPSSTSTSTSTAMLSTSTSTSTSTAMLSTSTSKPDEQGGAPERAIRRFPLARARVRSVTWVVIPESFLSAYQNS